MSSAGREVFSIADLTTLRVRLTWFAATLRWSILVVATSCCSRARSLERKVLLHTWVYRSALIDMRLLHRGQFVRYLAATLQGGSYSSSSGSSLSVPASSSSVSSSVSTYVRSNVLSRVLSSVLSSVPVGVTGGVLSSVPPDVPLDVPSGIYALLELRFKHVHST